MKKVVSVSGLVAPFPVRDVDTDMIIPAQHLTSTSRDGFGAHLFERFRGAGYFVDDPAFADAAVLVARDNFGCGSSREHAVWALLGRGIGAVVAPSFADIFAGNAGKNGLVLVRLPGDDVESILSAAASGPLRAVVDVSASVMETGDGRAFPFPLDPFVRHCLLEGVDELDYLLARRDRIGAHFASAPRFFRSPKAPAAGGGRP